MITPRQSRFCYLLTNWNGHCLFLEIVIVLLIIIFISLNLMLKAEMALAISFSSIENAYDICGFPKKTLFN